jgi:hypothetical protein
VINLSRASDEISGFLEGRCHSQAFGNVIFPVLVVLITTARARSQSAHQGGARGIAKWRGAIGIHERHTHFGKAIEVRRFRLRIAFGVADPVIQIVRGDEKDIRSGGFAFGGRIGKRAVRRGTKQKANKQKKKMSAHRAVSDEAPSKNVTHHARQFAAKHIGSFAAVKAAEDHRSWWCAFRFNPRRLKIGAAARGVPVCFRRRFTFGALSRSLFPT